MSYGRIRRGPMAADAFTQIRNDLFRDKRLSFKDKGVFGLISTHRDGYGVTPESIAHYSTDGVSAVKVALRNLEQYGYLQRTRQRNTDGTLGSSVYFITDQPEAFDDAPELENPSSAPEVENPPVDKPPVDEPPMEQPPVVQPPVENHPHKKTNSKNPSGKKTLSLPTGDPADSQPPAPAEREMVAAPSQKPTAAQRAVRSSGAVGLEEEQAFIAWATVKFDIQGAGWWKACADDIPEHVDVWRAGLVVRSRPSSDLPPWCGSCGAGSEHAARTNVRFRVVEILGERMPCPDCHPRAVQAA